MTQNTDDATITRQSLDFLYHTARRIHRLAEANVAKPGDAGAAPLRDAVKAATAPRDEPEIRTDLPDGAPRVIALLAPVAERFAASMIANVGGKPMVDNIGRWVGYAQRKRDAAKS